MAHCRKRLYVLHLCFDDVKLTCIKVALSRFQNILSADDASQIDYDFVEEHDAKPTKSAIRLKDLLETITGNFIVVFERNEAKILISPLN